MEEVALALDLNALPDEATREAVVRLLNLVERLHAENLALRQEVQQLKDEIARLNGEQGKPSFPAPRPPKPTSTPPQDYSSEPERRVPKPWQKRPKLDRIPLHRLRFLDLDPAQLPPDAQFKGYEPVIVQDLILRLENTCFCKAVFYSPSTQTSYRAPLPPGYCGGYGPGVRTLVLVWNYDGQMSQPRIRALLNEAGVLISSGQVCRLLLEGHDRFHAEAQEVARAGLGSSPWQHLDPTPTRVNGKEWACHILANPLYTGYHTTPSKARLCVLDVLRAGAPRRFRLDARALAYLEAVGLSPSLRQQVAALPQPPEGDAAWEERRFEELLAQALPRAGPEQRRRILEAGLWADYQAQQEVPVVRALVCDDAVQFERVTAELMLCWVHEGRHYKKLCPYLALHREALERFREQFWNYFRELAAYREQPSAAEAQRLAEKFDTLFATRTGYGLLDERIEKTQAKKAELLLVLTHPELPLTNNAAELGARGRVRKRDVSFGPRSAAGVKAWDTFQTLAATATKLGVSFYQYVHDRISGAMEMPSLAEVIAERAPQLNLGASWEVADPTLDH